MTIWRSNRGSAVAIVLLAIAASATGILNGFAYDDVYIIEANPAMRDVTQWWRAFASSYWPPEWTGDGYRPLTILVFKLEYLIGGGRPIVFHAANILLYAVSALLVFWLARRLMPLWAAWFAAAFFAVHPVHVEAVANVVGQSELLVAIAVVAATILYLRERTNGVLGARTAASIVVLYAVASLSKEHGLVLPAILIAAELTVIDDATHWRERLRRVRPFFLVLALVGVCVIWARSVVLADNSASGFRPYKAFATLSISAVDRVFTAIGIVPEWVRLLYWPARLSSDYAPPGIEIAQGFGLGQLPGLILLIAILSLAIALRRRRPVVSFGIALGCIALLPSSNFVLPAGFLVAERTLFLPSVGAMLALGGLLAWGAEYLQHNVAITQARRMRASAAVVGMVLMLAGGARSAQRSTVWHDNDRLFRQTVLDAPDSYRAHAMFGELNFRNNRLRDGEAEFRRALAMFPYDPGVAYGLAEHYRQQGLCIAAIPMYRVAHGIYARFRRGMVALAQCQLKEGKFKDAKATALEAIRNEASLRDMHHLIVLADSMLSRKLPDTVQKALEKKRVMRGP